MEKTFKIKSESQQRIGSILQDMDTHETFEVIDCERIGLFETYNWGLTLKEVTRGNE